MESQHLVEAIEKADKLSSYNNPSDQKSQLKILADIVLAISQHEYKLTQEVQAISAKVDQIFARLAQQR